MTIVKNTLIVMATIAGTAFVLFLFLMIGFVASQPRSRDDALKSCAQEAGLKEADDDKVGSWDDDVRRLVRNLRVEQCMKKRGYQ
jgi:hypothetical protein